MLCLISECLLCFDSLDPCFVSNAEFINVKVIRFGASDLLLRNESRDI